MGVPLFLDRHIRVIGMSSLELPADIKTKKYDGSEVKTLDKLFDLEAPSGIEVENVPEEIRQHCQYVNPEKCYHLKKNTWVSTDQQSMCKIDRLLKVKAERLEGDIQSLMRQSRMHRDKICQLQSTFCDVLHILRRDNEFWKIIHAHKVSIHPIIHTNGISDTCELQTMANKIKEDLTAEYRDTGDTRPLRQPNNSSKNSKYLSGTRREIVKRRRWRYKNYLISRYQRSVVTVAKENNNLKSKLDVLSKVKVKLKKEVGHWQSLVHHIDLSKPVEQPVLSNESQLTPESVPSEVTFALEVEKCAMKRSFMAPLPGFLNPVVHLDRCDTIAAYQKS